MSKLYLSVGLSPQQKAANTRKRNAFLAKIKERQDELRKDPRKLAGAIADEIEHDDLVTDDLSTGVEASEIENGQPHWNQESWGEFRGDPKNFTAVPGLRNLLVVKCPTTACVAGWATTLTGYRMVIRGTFESLREYFEPSEVMTTWDCLGPDGSVEQITSVAGKLLRLGYDETEWLFSGTRTKRQVVWALRNIEAHGPSYFDPEDCPFDED